MKLDYIKSCLKPKNLNRVEFGNYFLVQKSDTPLHLTKVVINYLFVFYYLILASHLISYYPIAFQWVSISARSNQPHVIRH